MTAKRPSPCNLAHLRTEIHGGIHHGEERLDGPQERRPQRGTDGGVSSDSRRIVVRCAGNQSKAEGAKSPARHGFGDTGAQTLFFFRILVAQQVEWVQRPWREGCILEAKALSPVAVSCCSCGENGEGSSSPFGFKAQPKSGSAESGVGSATCSEGFRHSAGWQRHTAGCPEDYQRPEPR